MGGASSTTKPEEKIVRQLLSEYENTSIEIDGKYYDSWKTPWGIDFISITNWMFYGKYVTHDKHHAQSLHPSDIIQIINILKKDPTKAQKSQSICTLEKYFEKINVKIKIKHHKIIFGGWSVIIGDNNNSLSLFNNPLEIDEMKLHSSNADNFEVYSVEEEESFFHKNQQTIDDIIKIYHAQCNK